MQQIAAAIGTVIGYAIGYILKIAGDDLRKFIVGCIREAMNDTAEVGTSTGPLDNAWNVLVRDETHSNSIGGNGDHPKEGGSGLPGQ